MFILLTIILTFIAISLKLSASSLELAYTVTKRKFKSPTKNIGIEVANLGVATSIAFIRVVAFVVSRVRDLMSMIASLMILIDAIVLVLLFVTAGSTVALFYENDVDGSIIGGANSQISSGSNSSLDGSFSGSKPLGISDESWNKADATGKKIISFAANTILNPPNGKYLLYMQGDTGVGYADCSVFVSGVLEGALNKTFSGVDAPNGYDFANNKKSDLQGYVTTYGMESIINKKPLSKIGTTRTSLSVALPGDILLTDGHVGFYVGKNENGIDVMVHASTSTNPTCSGDITLSDGKNLEVGFSRVWGDYDIIRPSILLGK